MKKYQLNCRMDEEINDIFSEVMQEESCNKSEALVHIVKTFKKNNRHLSANQKKIYAVYMADMDTAISKLPKEYREELLAIQGGFKCQIL